METRLGNGQEPKAGTFHSKIGGAGGNAGLELEPNKEFAIIVRNPGNKPASADIKLTSKGK